MADLKPAPKTWSPLGWNDPAPGNLGPARGAKEPGQGFRGLNPPGIRDLDLESVCGGLCHGRYRVREQRRAQPDPHPAHQPLISDFLPPFQGISPLDILLEPGDLGLWTFLCQLPTPSWE